MPTEVMGRKRFVVAALAIVLLGTVAAAALNARLARAPELHGTVLEPPLPAAEFALTTSGGDRIGPQHFRGSVVVLFFGFTNCPDVCPLTLQRLAGAMDALGDRADGVQVILVSVDPERDTPEAVDDYARRFHARFAGVTGTEEELRQVASRYGIFFAANPVDGETGYTVDHSASTLVLDRNGRLRMIWPFDTQAEDFASDLAWLLRR
jgi:protein SCO1